jgi:hypothetical protein
VAGDASADISGKGPVKNGGVAITGGARSHPSGHVIPPTAGK